MNIVHLNDLLEALQDAKNSRKKYNLDDWGFCPYGIYRKFMGIKIPKDEIGVCTHLYVEDCDCKDAGRTNEDIYNEIQNKFELTTSELEHLFGNTGPRTLDEAIARVEKLLNKVKETKEVSPTLRVKLKTKKRISFNDLYKNDTFRYQDELYVKISDTRAFNYHNSVLRECWEFGSGIEKTNVEIVEI